MLFLVNIFIIKLINHSRDIMFTGDNLQSSLREDYLKFLSHLDNLNKKEANEYIKSHLEIYKKCLEFVASDEDQVKEHLKALKWMTSMILEGGDFNSTINNVIKIACKQDIISSSNALHQAVKNHNVEIVKALLELGFSPNAIDKKGNAPFFYCIKRIWSFEKEMQQIRDLFLQHPDFDPNISNKAKISFIIEAFQSNDIPLVIELIKKGALTDNISSDFIFPQDYCSGLRVDRLPFSEAFESLPGVKDIKEKEMKTFLFEIWISPLDLRHVEASQREWNKFFELLLENQPFVEYFPNLITIILSRAIQLDVSSEKLIQCLDANPKLLDSYHGKELMRSAIENGHLGILRELVQRGVNPNELYGEPLKNSRLSSSTPMHHALMLNKRDIAEFLISNETQPVTLKICDKEGKSIFQHLIENPKFLETHSLTISWLIDQKDVDVEAPNGQGKTVLSLIAEDPQKRGWPLVAKLLEKGAHLNGKARLFLWEKALQSEQLSIASLILHQAGQSVDDVTLPMLIEAMKFSDLEALLLIKNQTWVQNTLTQLTEQGLKIDKYCDEKGNTLLGAVIQRKNYSLAAFLISLGADLDKQNLAGATPADLLKNQGVSQEDLFIYAKGLKEGTVAEQRLRQDLFLKNLAHLLGDSFLAEMKDSSGERLEGNMPSISLDFMHKILNYLVESKDLNEEVREKLETLSAQFATTIELALQIEDAARLNPADPHLQTAIERLSQVIYQKLDQLEIGESLLIPYGWTGYPSGHATMLMCKRVENGYIFDLINTGEGLEYHASQATTEKFYLDTVHSFFITKENLEDKQLLQQMIAPAILGTGANTARDRRFAAPDIYQVLQPYEREGEMLEDSATSLSSAWMRTQLSGTCSFRCLLAIIASTVNQGEYKSLNPLMKEHVIQMAFDLNRGLLKQDLPLAKILSETTPRLFGHVAKSILRLPPSERTTELLQQKAANLDQLEEFHQEFLQALPPKASENPPLNYSESLTSQTERVKESVGKIPQQIPTVIPDKTAPEVAADLPVIKPETIKTGKELIEALETFEAYLKRMKALNKPVDAYAGIFLRDLGRLFLRKGPRQANVLADLEKDSQACMKALEGLEFITDYYFDETGKKRGSDGMRFIALNSSLAVGWMIGNLVDNQQKVPPECALACYGLRAESLYSKLIYKDIDPLLFPEMIPDFRRLWIFFAETEDEARRSLKEKGISGNYPPLFNFSAHGQITDEARFNYVALRPNTGDYCYAEKYASMSSEEETIAQEELERQLKDYPEYKEVDPTKWKVNWYYIKDKLPAHFRHLRHLALMAHMENPDSVSANRSSQIHYSGPTLRPHPNVSEKLLISYSLDGGTRVGTNAKLMLQHPEPSDFKNCIPKENAGILYAAPSRDSRLVDSAMVAPREQNSILTKTTPRLHDLLTLRSVYNRSLGSLDASVPLTMLIDHFEENLPELAKQESRIIFATCLNQTLKLYETLKTEEGKTLLDDYMEFFHNAIDHFHAQLLFNQDKVNSLHALLFLYEQKQRVLRTAIAARVSDPGLVDKLAQTRQEVRNLFSLPQCSHLQDKQYLCLILIDSFNVESELSPSEIEELIRLRTDLERFLLETDRTPLVFPTLWNTVKVASIQHKNEIQAYLHTHPKERNQLMQQLLAQFGVDTQEMEWVEHGFPHYLCEKEGSFYQVDVLTGEALKEGRPFSPLASFREERVYEELFGKEILVGTEAESYIESQDKQGDIRFYAKNLGWGRPQLDSVHRKIDREWYKYIPSHSAQYPLLPPLPEAEYLHVWQSVDKEKKEFLIVDKRTMKPKYRLDEEGYFYFPPGSDAKRYEWVNIATLEQGKGIAHFDPSALLWKPAPKEGEEPYPPLLLFPHYKDEQGNIVEFRQEGSDWICTAAPHLKIAEKQALKGISDFTRFLVLEDKTGEQEALIPKQTLLQMKEDKSFSSVCESMKLENGQAVSRLPSKNVYLAYLSLAHAITPQDYARAMEYLKGAFSFERYSPEDLRFLGWIFNINKEKTDKTGSMDSVRLYAAWLVYDNFKRNPSPTVEASSGRKVAIPSRYAPVSDWEAYWQNNWSWEKKGRSMNLSRQLDELTKHYLARRSKVHHSIKLEAILDSQELVNWGYDKRSLHMTGIVPPADLPKEVEVGEIDKLEIFKVDASKIKTPFTLQMRPGKEFAQQFSRLYQLAKSPSQKERQGIERLLNGMAYDPYPNNAALRKILQATLMVSEGDSSKAGFEQAQKVVECMDIILLEARGSGRHGISVKELNSLVKAFALATSSKIHFRPVKTGTKKGKPVTEIIPKLEPRVLPEEFPQTNKLIYNPSVGDLRDIHDFYEAYLEPKQHADISVEIQPISSKTDDSFIQESLHKLNHDYQVGAQKNQTAPVHELRAEVTLEETAVQLKQQLKEIHDQDVKIVEKLKGEMLKLARTLPEDLEEQVLERAAILGGKKIEIGEPECIALFLQADPEEFKRLTHLTKGKDIQALYQIIGDYLSLSRKVAHVHILQQQVGELKELIEEGGKEEDKKALLQKIGNGLSQIKYVDPALDPNAFLVLEYGLNLFLKEDQVEGLRAMLPRVDAKKFPNVLLQRIQGGGKTLVFGHTLALLKADGYHLSIHVPPTPQYGTARYDMQHISGKVYGQKERTLEFDDNPQRFTVEYLTWMRDTMITAVVNKEYISMTNETLRAMRCKYIKTRLIIQRKLASSRGVETSEIMDLERSNAILKEMLMIMRSRGVFTFDEVHQAFDPRKELNMPFGKFTQISVPQAKVMAKLMVFAANSRDELGFLLKLHENQQSQQTESQYEKMLIKVTDQFLNDVDTQNLLGLFDRKETDQKLLRDYLLGIEENLPPFIAEKTEHAIRLLQIFQHLDEVRVRCLSTSQAEEKESLVKEFLEKFSQDLNIYDEAQVDDLKAYFFGNTEQMPEFLMKMKVNQQSVKDAADLIVLCKQMLAGKWLKDRLDKSVDEHHGFSSTAKGPRIAIPYVANTKPSEGSEFSDRYVMITNTLMTYAIQGLSAQQVKELIDHLKKQADTEYRNGKEETPDFKLKDTKAARQFAKICGMDLFMIDSEDPQTIAALQKVLLARDEGTMEFLYNYVITHELPKVEIFETQVCSHGRNTISMGQSHLGYSGSLDNANLAPLGTEIQPELGTNGQTIDLLIRENDDVWAIKPASRIGKDSLFADLMEKHPFRALIRALIDVGCHFRGIPNEEVARMICRYLREINSPIAGVLYFDAATGALYFMNKNQPDKPQKLSGTRPETIRKETGYPPSLLFSYYDQDHITGTDILQEKDTKAIITWSEHTKIHEELQGGRRLRELPLQQRLITAVEQGALSKMGSKLDKPGMASIEVGKIDPSEASMKDLVLFSHLAEAEAQREENLLFCLQDIENNFQEYILDTIYDLPLEKERELFARASHLFAKNIALDLYLEYAFKRQQMPVKDYLIETHRRLMAPLIDVLEERKVDEFNFKLEQIIDKYLPGLKPTIEVSRHFLESHEAIGRRNSEGTMVQFREQEKATAKQAERVQENVALQQSLNQTELSLLKTHETAVEIPLVQKDLEDPSFAKNIQKYDAENPCLRKSDEWSGSGFGNETEEPSLEVWGLGQVLEVDLGAGHAGLFDPNLLVTSNFAIAWQNRVDLLTGFRKKPFQWLLIADEVKGRKEWKLVLVSAEDAVRIKKHLKKANLPEGRSMYLLRASSRLKPLIAKGEELDPFLFDEEPQVRKLVAEAMLFSGNLYQLNQRRWRDALDEALPKGQLRIPHQKFFEEKVLREQPLNYPDTPLYSTLHAGTKSVG